MNKMASFEKPEKDNETSSEKNQTKMKSPRTKGCKIDPIQTKEENGTEKHMIEKTVSYGELSSKYVKLDPCTESGNNTLFFNERGWPVKIIRLTEDSPPKAKKPWPSRSLPSASIKSAHKEKTIFTQTKSTQNSFKENKENKVNRPRPTYLKETTKQSKENNASNSKPIQGTHESHDEKPLNVDNLKSDLKQALDYLDEVCLDTNKISSQKNTVIEKDIVVQETGAKITPKEQAEKKKNKNERKENLNWKQHEKKVSTNEQKESSLGSARSNKYNSKEMKAYIQAKRTERKQQISEEARKKQEMIELQRRNLEKLRERASKVLRKPSVKTVEESKPKWQGPLEEEVSEESPSGIHIFESKIPTAKKSKSSVKSDCTGSEFGVDINEKQESLKRIFSGKICEDIEKSTFQQSSGTSSIQEISKITMNRELQSKKSNSDKPMKLLRKSKTPCPLEEQSVIASVLVQAAAEHLPQLRKDLEEARKSDQSEIKYPPSPGSWYQLPTEDSQAARRSYDSRRETFNVSQASSYHSFKTPTASPYKHTESHQTKSISNVRKGYADDTAKPPCEIPARDFADHLKKAQEAALLKPESFFQSDPFNIINMMKLKNFNNQKADYLGADRKSNQHLTSVCNSNDDETDAPSIVSMEEDSKVAVEPVRISDLNLEIPTSNKSVSICMGNSSPWTLHSSHGTFKAHRKPTDESMKTSATSYTSEALPLELPDHLKLTSKSASELSSSASHKFQAWQSLSKSIESASVPFLSSFEKRIPVSPSQMSISDKTNYRRHSSQKDVKEQEGKSNRETYIKSSDGQFKISQVLSSAALLLRFHAELSRIDAFDQSLAQVIAAERLYHCSTSHPPSAPDQLSRVLETGSPQQLQTERAETTPSASMPGSLTHTVPERISQSSQLTTSLPEQLTSEQRLESPCSNVSSVHSRPLSDRLLSDHLPALQTSRLSAPSSLLSVEELSNIQGIAQDDVKSSVRKLSPSMSSMTVLQSSVSPKNIHFLQVMIDDAEFQRKQHQLLYKTQEDILHANYRAALTEVELRFRGFPGPDSQEAIKKENYTRSKIEEHFKTAIANIKRTRKSVLSNWSKRIEDLSNERDQLKKQLKKKLNNIKVRSADHSPKKHTPLRSTSATSVIESSSSESSIMALDEKKRQENKEKVSQFDKKKLEKDLHKVLNERQEFERMERLLKFGRSRRDKSTSPLQSVQEASTRDVACSVTDTMGSPSASHHLSSSLQSVEEARATDMYNSESFESPESSETPRQARISRTPLASKPFVTARTNSKSKVLIKGPLAPRVPLRTRRPCSSGSDESLLLSQNETLSEQSDYEGKVTALQEQKRQRLAVYNRLQKELKKAQKELLKSTAASLIKQIQVYDSYIAQTKQQLEEVSASKVVVRPQIKHPRMSDRFMLRNSDILQRKTLIEDQLNQLEAPVSDVESNSLKSVSEASSTETTIQSSGMIHIATEPTSAKTKVNVEVSFEVVPSDSDASEVLSSIVTETITAPDTQKSPGSVDESLGVEEVQTKSVQESPEIEWVTAEKYLDQIGHPDESLLEYSSNYKLSPKGSLITTISEKNMQLSQDTVSMQHSSNDESVQEEILETEVKVTSQSSETAIESATSDFYTNENPLDEEESAVPTSPSDNFSEKLDVGTVVSIISQSPLSRTPKSSSSICDSPIVNPDEHETHESDPVPIEDGSLSDNELSVSIAISKKSDVSEPVSLNQSNEVLIISDPNSISQHSSEDDANTSTLNQSDEDDQSEISQSEVIKVFVCSKNQENNGEDISIESNETKLDETYIVHEAKDKSTLEESVPDKKAVIDKITDNIMSKLLSECFLDPETSGEKHCKTTNGFQENIIISINIRNQTIDESVDDITNTVLDKFVQDATDCMIKLNESRKVTQFNLKNSEINLEASSLNSALLDALALEGKRSVLNKAQGDRLTSPINKSAQNLSNEVDFNGGGSTEVFWLDEEVRPVSLQAQREAEELRLKQLQIEQEIKQLEQAQENIPSYYYVREIPNKPPPPYTPPRQDSAPTRRKDVERLTRLATETLTVAWEQGSNLTLVHPSEPFTTGHSYKRFLFDLVRQIFIEVTSNQDEDKDIPPWDQTGTKIKRLAFPKLTVDSVKCFVLKKVRVVFGLEPSSIKENLIIQWSRKKRDRVDELLVRESQEEEHEWIDYSKCEVAVKNNVVLSIFDNLVDETTLALSKAFQKKIQYCLQSL